MKEKCEQRNLHEEVTYTENLESTLSSVVSLQTGKLSRSLVHAL